MKWLPPLMRWYWWVGFVTSAIVIGIIGIWLLLILLAPLARRSH